MGKKRGISTIIVRIDPECIKAWADEFDKNVAAAMEDGWKLVSAGMTEHYLWAIVTGNFL